ncbi:OprD family outer membrane porin [Endozoicomonas arenosclerae]|uniref:OprD family outer membrane porin n=1 Tax=Endozoicomonas arenosclerae TaxID=1633495 RepID=UPI000783A26A|nr:OprD family outer membrane porin [Endozoicomonas arenosclerae]
MFKKTMLASAVMAAAFVSTGAQAEETGNPFFDDATISGGIYNFTRIRDRKDAPGGDYEENIHHSTAMANLEFNSGLYNGWFGVDMGVFGTYDLWNSGTSQYSEFSLINDKGEIHNGFSVYKANVKFDFGAVKARTGYLQPSGPGVLGVNWSFAPGTYSGSEITYSKGGLNLAYFWANEYKSPWTYDMEGMMREDGTRMSYVHSMGASYDFDNGVSVLGAFGQGEDYVDMYKFKLGYNNKGLGLSYQFYGIDDKADDGTANDLYDGLGYQHAITSSLAKGNWTYRAEATYTRAKGQKGAFVFRPTYASGESNGSYEVWWDQRSDFNHDGEKAVFAGAWYDFTEMGYAGWTAGFSVGYGWGAESQDTSVTTEELEEIGYSVDLGYTFQTGNLKGATVALHATYFDLKTDVGSYTTAFPNAFQDEKDIKLMFMMPFTL